MKEIELPITQTVSATIQFTKEGIIDKDIGFIINTEIQESMRVARNNGGKILYATTSIEQELESFLMTYFMGPFNEPDARRHLFENELLKSTIMSFSSKKSLFIKILNSKRFIKGSEKEQLTKQLNTIMNWRNAFAHGKVQHDTEKGCSLKYYSGNQKEQILDDKYWDTVLSVFESCKKLLTKSRDNMQRKLYPDSF
ncbi:hypothetical protein Q4530_02750 [Colwellia sp. 1_MG-2023]|uniref:hypothetical protein n=1 Tax=unclassified Colwellia TaxID=196834 RepID=UPI001C092FA2|nr:MULTISPECIES: hypothetical protein [unclassified Colwellia]MBU2923201.1 hypothetical protein [Colwellia sp. C2M11]MDO6651369.1 hypothetical protein [Colwellia sp. 3_MG-2023]MDO6664208.1 hypothetical protein [Colwellia sp. 2_MG-2023]MDO6688678.1 hypothetical protein [Colwellia sp. 1_MG-2023]